MNHTLRLKDLQSLHISLKSKKQNGDSVATAVWFAAVGGHLFVRTTATSGKIKRINRYSEISITCCDAAGVIAGEPIECQAMVLANNDPDIDQAEIALQQKYGEERTKMTQMMTEQQMPLAYIKIYQ